ncbi:hypothetical protein ACU5AX_18840 [Sphingomonas sp. XXL09]|jgi:hypothetical protein|uniref:hypothetical protein n=1 Tax=Sphingomonas sp. XXL09 TaxID=3457787 RepID=UPI00406BCF76
MSISLIFVLSVLLSVGSMACYQVGMLSLRTFGLIGGPAICVMLAAAIIGPPSPPLTCGEIARGKAQDDGYVLGFATGMMMPR